MIIYDIKVYSQSPISAWKCSGMNIYLFGVVKSLQVYLALIAVLKLINGMILYSYQMHFFQNPRYFFTFLQKSSWVSANTVFRLTLTFPSFHVPYTILLHVTPLASRCDHVSSLVSWRVLQSISRGIHLNLVTCRIA